MRMCTSGNVTVERGKWEDTKGLPGFAWDAYKQENVRVTIRGDSSVEDLVRSGAARSGIFDYGHGKEKVCRVWLCAPIRDAQTLSIVQDMIMPSGGYVKAPEVDTEKMDLLQAATAVVMLGIGRRLPNWTKRALDGGRTRNL
jgi:hypothetical protein